MRSDPVRRRALIEAFREVARVAGTINRFFEEVDSEVKKSLRDALGVPGPEEQLLRKLYTFKPAKPESTEELKRLIARYMGLEDSGVDVFEYLRSPGSSSTGHDGEGRREPPLNDAGEGGRDEDRQLHSNRG
ncbi:hypothetical protein PYJP_17960 [Pyrofollis japonicus]|nr:hypothetical protein PYJP_17960 [Pyrofollis japonicus]